MMKVGIFDPYLDTLGGGERYMMTVAEWLADLGHKVDVFWNEKSLKKDIKVRLGLNLGKTEFVEDIFSSKRNLFKKWQITKKYDLFFYLSDGSVPLLLARKNILHFQVPFHQVGGRSFLNRIKQKQIKTTVCNSKFTKKFIDKEYGVKSLVIYPPVSVEKFKPGKKENIILSVGRFTDVLHKKRQDVLVEVFKKLVDKDLNGWQLVLVGSDKEGKKLISKIKKAISGYPVKIKTNVSFVELQKLYAQAKIFWTAAGFGVDEDEHPEQVEHFGMTTVEAMAAGCVPVVINKGGQKEIVDQGQNGFLWQNKEELIKLTLGLIKDESFLRNLSRAAIKKSKNYSLERFYEAFEKII